MRTQTNPFHVGEDIIYSPSIKGRGSIINTDLAALIPGNNYTVSQIEGDYVIIVGFENCVPSTLFWTEFKKKLQ